MTSSDVRGGVARLVGFLTRLAAVVLLGAVLGISEHAGSIALTGQPAFVCDSHDHAAVSAQTTAECEPPSTYDRHTTDSAVRRSGGPSARPEPVASSTTITYDASCMIAPGVDAARTARERPAGDGGAPSELTVSDLAANGASGLSDDLARLANQHVTGSGDTVLGRYPGYINKANSKGASYFDIGDDWNKLVARGQDPWVLNQHFSDGRIAAGDRILLSVPKGDIVPGTYLAREVQYLTSNGYRWTNQWSLRPGG